jgi:hypothetical protein
MILWGAEETAKSGTHIRLGRYNFRYAQPRWIIQILLDSQEANPDLSRDMATIAQVSREL